MLLNEFLEGVGVCDNAGNLPLHFAASLAEGIEGEEIIKALIKRVMMGIARYQAEWFETRIIIRRLWFKCWIVFMTANNISTLGI